MKPTRVSACVFAVAASLAGCMATGDVEYAGSVRVTSPELITVSPGVQVIADADEPLFYSHNTYWLYRDGYWYRSDNYRNGFARVDFVYVPGELRIIDRPQLYVQYKRHNGRDRFARPTQQQTRTLQPTQTPYQTTSPTEPLQPNQPAVPGQEPSGIRPTSPTTTYPPPRPEERLDRDRAGMPPGQANRPDDDRGNRPDDRGNRPDDRGPQQVNPPGQTNRPDDRGNRPDDRGNGNAKGNATPPGQTNRPDDRGERNKSDRDDRGTPPTEKPDKDKDKPKKNEKY